MTDLRDLLVRRIATNGPMSVAEYMAECLFHPSLGYYTTAEVFGAGGDFTTAPEISQMFGELLGLALARIWQEQGRPAQSVLAELGPGRGTLMADVLRVAKRVPGFRDALTVHLVETSPRLRQVQRVTLGLERITWSDHVGDLPDAPLFLLANEFFDALPIRQFLRERNGWRERLIGCAGDRLCFTLAAPVPLAVLPLRLASVAEGETVEICPALPAITEEISRRIASNGGAALILDYGEWRSRGDTFQALRRHRPQDPLEAPGTADLTAHVDFEAISDAARDAGAASSGMTRQGLLLERLGITERARSLAPRMPSEAALQSHIAAHRRLTHPEEMGSLFKAIAIYRQGAPLPPGFDP